MARTRERMVVSTALLVREQGARATSIDDVLAHSGAPRGSVYHHFPGGRAQLLREATQYAGEYVARRIERAQSGPELLDAFLESYREQLIASDFRAGCPIVAVAVEAQDPDAAEADLPEQAAAVFARWTGLLQARLEADGVPEPRANELAVFALSSLEGALVLAQARRDPAPLDIVHRQLQALLAHAGEESPA